MNLAMAGAFPPEGEDRHSGASQPVPPMARSNAEIMQLTELYQQQLIELNAAHSLLMDDQAQLAARLAPCISDKGIITTPPDPELLLLKQGLDLRLLEFEEDRRRIQQTERRLQRKIDECTFNYESLLLEAQGFAESRLITQVKEQQRIIELQQNELDELRFQRDIYADESTRLRGVCRYGDWLQDGFGAGYQSPFQSPRTFHKLHSGSKPQPPWMRNIRHGRKAHTPARSASDFFDPKPQQETHKRTEDSPCREQNDSLRCEANARERHPARQTHEPPVPKPKPKPKPIAKEPSVTQQVRNTLESWTGVNPTVPKFVEGARKSKEAPHEESDNIQPSRQPSRRSSRGERRGSGRDTFGEAVSAKRAESPKPIAMRQETSSDVSDQPLLNSQRTLMSPAVSRQASSRASSRQGSSDDRVSAGSAASMLSQVDIMRTATAIFDVEVGKTAAATSRRRVNRQRTLQPPGPPRQTRDTRSNF